MYVTHVTVGAKRPSWQISLVQLWTWLHAIGKVTTCVSTITQFPNNSHIFPARLAFWNPLPMGTSPLNLTEGIGHAQGWTQLQCLFKWMEKFASVGALVTQYTVNSWAKMGSPILSRLSMPGTVVLKQNWGGNWWCPLVLAAAVTLLESGPDPSLVQIWVYLRRAFRHGRGDRMQLQPLLSFQPPFLGLSHPPSRPSLPRSSLANRVCRVATRGKETDASLLWRDFQLLLLHCRKQQSLFHRCCAMGWWTA